MACIVYITGGAYSTLAWPFRLHEMATVIKVDYVMTCVMGGGGTQEAAVSSH